MLRNLETGRVADPETDDHDGLFRRPARTSRMKGLR